MIQHRPPPSRFRIPEESTVRSTWLVHGSAVAAAVLLGVSGPLLMTAQAWPVQAAHVVLSAGRSWAALAFGAGTRAGSLSGSAVLGAYALRVCPGDRGVHVLPGQGGAGEVRDHGHE